jgi:hypothetical protein
LLKHGPLRDESVRPGGRLVGVEQCEGWDPQGIPCGMAASTGMSKDKKPLEIIWNNYKSLKKEASFIKQGALSSKVLLEYAQPFLPSNATLDRVKEDGEHFGTLVLKEEIPTTRLRLRKEYFMLKSFTDTLFLVAIIRNLE